MTDNKNNVKNEIVLMIIEVFKKKRDEILSTWMDNQHKNVTLRLDLITRDELEKQSKEFLNIFLEAVTFGNLEDIDAPEYKSTLGKLEDISATRAVQGFTASETATYIFSLKDAFMQFLQETYRDQPEQLNKSIVIFSKLIDQLGLVTFETFAKSREKVILDQTKMMADIATPVQIIWGKILMLPIVGSVDSKRAQDIMDMLLQKILDTESKVVILDILGVAMVDTAVANHMIKITKATRLMGCETIISGISPLIAQSLVQLGVALENVTTCSTLKDALEFAFTTTGLHVTKIKKI